MIVQITTVKIGIVVGTFISVATASAMLGYNAPWYTRAEGLALAMAEYTDHKETIQSLNELRKGLDDGHVNALLTQKSILLMQKDAESKARDEYAAQDTQARIEWINSQLRHPNQAPPPPP